MSPKRPRIVITRPTHQADSWVRKFEEDGFEVVLLPLLEVVEVKDDRPLRAMAAELAAATTAAGAGQDVWLAVTSANAVDPLCDRMPAGTRWETVRAASVGKATAAALQRRGIEPRLVGQGTAADLARELVNVVGVGAKVLVPQAADARPDLVDGLRNAGVEVKAAVAYDKVLPAGTIERAREIFRHEIGWVTFTSPRIVRHFLDVLAEVPGGMERLGELKAWSIGPVTSKELRRAGVKTYQEPESALEHQASSA